MSRVFPASVLFFFTAVLLSTPAGAQFWPFGNFYRGYRPPPQGSIFDALRPFDVQPPKMDRGKKNTAKTEVPQKKPETPPAPYEAEFSRLAEVLGALHYLRQLCGEKETIWRSQMQELLDSEQPTGDRRDRLIASFNRGYQSYELTYRNCTPSADLAISRFLGEGARLSHDIAARYGN
jgi:uncharacterized protein (TIGR02301 family)